MELFLLLWEGAGGGLSINQNPLPQFQVDKIIFFIPHVYSMKQFEVCAVLFCAGCVLVADDWGAAILCIKEAWEAKQCVHVEVGNSFL